MGLRIYLDDLRTAPEGWVRTYGAEEAIDLIESREAEVEALSFDHDLGEQSLSGAWATTQVIRLLTEGRLRGLKLMRIHTSSDGSGMDMERMFRTQTPMVRDAIPAALRVVRIPGGDPMDGPGKIGF